MIIAKRPRRYGSYIPGTTSLNPSVVVSFFVLFSGGGMHVCWAEAPIKIARMTLTIKLDGNWSSFQLANSTPPLSVTDSAIAPSARMHTLATRPKIKAQL